jgi:hypothetical protein
VRPSIDGDESGVLGAPASVPDRPVSGRGVDALRQAVSPRRLYCGLAIGMYLILIGAVLAWTHGLPYGSDNNESFSAFTHARNLLQFGFGQTVGLTDEAYSLDPPAHPYVYTHEGNLPRLVVYLLMRLGLMRIEWQIALLAVLVGSATMYFCFAFFSRAAGNLFAFLACAVLATDYLSFLQWQINSFRVWHGFFFFACLLCVQSAGGPRGRTASAVWFMTCAALFYFEVVFAVFAVATSICYGLLIYWRRRNLVYHLALIAGAGAIVAIGGLVAQSAAHLGWPVAWRDLQLTVLNRNFYVQSGVESAAEQTLQFFIQHHIVYWRDNPDTRGFLRLTSFLRTFGKFGLLVDTPYLVSLMAIVTVAWLLRPLARARIILELGSGTVRISPGRAGFVVLFLCIAAGYELAHLRLYGTDFAPLWRGAIEDYFRLRLILAGLIAAVLIGSLVILERGVSFGGLHGDRGIKEGSRYLAAAVGGYVFVYVVSPGYLSQGYLVRYVPLAVFIVDVWIALFLYMLIVLARAYVPPAVGAVQGAGSTVASAAERRATVTLRLMQGLSIFLLIFVAVYWARVQAVYVTAMPLNDYAFMPQLAQPPYRGATFISDVYAAPIAYFTGTWAYADDLVYGNHYVEREGRVVQLISGDKLWEADRDTNRDYLHPQYYLCARTPNLYTAAIFVMLRRGERLSQCSSEVLVRDARKGVGPFHNTVVAQDQGPWDMWAIVRLDPSIQFVFADPGENVTRLQDADRARARRLVRGIQQYYADHGCYPRPSARSFGAMPEGLGAYVGGAWPRTQMYGAYDRDWQWVTSGGVAHFIGVIPYSVWTSTPRAFLFVVDADRVKMC